MVMTAGAVRRLLDPAQTSQREALTDVEGVGREAVGEMHRIVSALRDGQEPAPADLRRVSELIGQARRTGARISIDAEGLDVEDLPLAVSGAAYRIVQESLTNVLRHAPGAPAAVRLRLEAAGLRIDVADDGAAGDQQSPARTGGFGIQGMRERAALLGGALDAGPRGDGAGWRVSAWLPA
jgi:signal transduction histidine kinase